MSTTPDWMHGSEDWNRPLERRRLPLVAIVFWVIGPVITAFTAVAVLHFS
jgi:hypothetical protein